MTTPGTKRPYDLAKRLMDVVVAAIAVVVAGPVLALARVIIRLDDGPPTLFHQTRAGRGGVRITVAKLRTMAVDAGDPSVMGQVTTSHPLVTRSGKVLRRTKVDELPQLWAVLNGSLSLVGPRPTLPEQAAAYDAFQIRRLDIRPGLTGWAQVNGNTALGWDDRIRLDVWYVDHRSLRLDLEILAKTLKVIARGERISEQALRIAADHEAALKGVAR